MIDAVNERVRVTMCGVDPACLGGVSTLTRMLSLELSRCSDVDFAYVSTANQGSRLRKLACFTTALGQVSLRCSTGSGVVHIHMADNASVVRSCVIIRMARSYEQVIVLHIHCDLARIREASPPYMRQMIDWAIVHADCVIALGSYLDSLFRDLGYPAKRVLVLPNAVACPHENLYGSGRRAVLFLGDVSDAKGVSDLLDALSRIDGELDSGITVELCGRDHMDVAAAIKRRGLAHRVRYRGVVTPDADFFAHYALNVLPSHHEAMPFALLEASAYGIPSVATTVGSIPEVIDDGNSGWLVEAGDVNSLAAVLLHAVSHPDALSKASDLIYQTVRERHSLEGYIQTLISLYEGMNLR